MPEKVSKSFSLMHRSSKLEDEKAKIIQNKMNYLRVSRDKKISQSQHIERRCKIVQDIRVQAKREK